MVRLGKAPRITAGAALAGMLAVASAGSARAATILAQFQGGSSAQSPFVPPDMGGSVGGGYVVQMVNGWESVFTTGGSSVVSQSLGAFWGTGTQISDPRVVFDPSSQRWFASAITVPGGSINNPNSILIAVSANANPTSGFTTLSFASANSTSFADFPTLGVNGAAVTIGTNDFSTANSAYLGSSLFSIPKADLTGASPTVANRSVFVQSSLLGNAPQAVTNAAGTGTSTSVISVGSNAYLLDTVSGANAAGASLTQTQSYTSSQIAAAGLLNTTLIPPTQPGGTTYDPGDTRISSGAYQSGNNIYFANTVNGGSGDQIAWSVLNATTNGVAASGMIEIAGLSLSYGSISANANGTFVVAFNGSGTGQNITDYYVVCSAITGTCGAPQIAYVSPANDYYSAPRGTNRWGDYSWTTVDPNNPTNFWLFQEFAASNTGWGTMITEIATGSSVPEPAGVALLGIGLIGLGLARRSRHAGPA